MPPYLGSSQGGREGVPPLVIGEGEADCEPINQVDASSLCGNQVVPVSQEKPNLYFVVDASGSMAQQIGVETKLLATKGAVIDVARQLGHRVRYGLAAFPDPGADAEALGCAAGSEVFETREGDPLRCRNRRGGPILDKFIQRVLDLEAAGGTPLTPTLKELRPVLEGLDGPTYVVLMTDGGPNCNPTAACSADECLYNLLGLQLPATGTFCDEDHNCCDSAVVATADRPALANPPELECIDDADSVATVQALHEAGIDTYVVGVPGSEDFAEIMNALAVAGGTARAGDTDYFDVRDVDELNQALMQIGAEVAQSCTIELDQKPTDPTLVNVYFDTQLVPADDTEGWVLSETELTLVGEACDTLQAGGVDQIQIVAGCPTVVVR